MEAYGVLLHAGLTRALDRMASQPPPSSPPGAPVSPAAAARILRLEGRGFLALLGQLREMRCEFSLGPEGLASDVMLAARPGSPLADLASMPPPGANGAAALLGGRGVMTATYQLDPARLAAFLAAMAREAASDPEVASLLTPEVMATVDDMGRVWTGQLALRVGPGAGTPLAVETVMGVTSEGDLLGMVDKGVRMLAGEGALPAFYKDVGMPLRLSLRRNVRTHAGVNVHRLQMGAETRGLTEEQKAMQALIVRDSEFAVARGYYLSAQDPAALDRLIDRAAAGASGDLALESARAFGPGRHFYVDYDFLGLLGAMGPAFWKGQDSPLAGLESTAADPVIYAVTLAGGEVRIESRLPLRPFVLLAEAIRKKAPAPAK
jgi:hypothetical protein